jgi:L-rhamnose mutarotase
LQRVAFLLQIKPGKIEEYDEAHRHVWPELIRELEAAGVTEYSIFRRGLQLFLTMRVVDLAPLFDAVPDNNPSEPLAMMEEVFYMPGVPNVSCS